MAQTLNSNEPTKSSWPSYSPWPSITPFPSSTMPPTETVLPTIEEWNTNPKKSSLENHENISKEIATGEPTPSSSPRDSTFWPSRDYYSSDATSSQPEKDTKLPTQPPTHSTTFWPSRDYYFSNAPSIQPQKDTKLSTQPPTHSTTFWPSRDYYSPGATSSQLQKDTRLPTQSPTHSTTFWPSRDYYSSDAPSSKPQEFVRTTNEPTSSITFWPSRDYYSDTLSSDQPSHTESKSEPTEINAIGNNNQTAIASKADQISTNHPTYKINWPSGHSENTTPLLDIISTAQPITSTPSLPHNSINIVTSRQPPSISPEVVSQSPSKSQLEESKNDPQLNQVGLVASNNSSPSLMPSRISPHPTYKINWPSSHSIHHSVEEDQYRSSPDLENSNRNQTEGKKINTSQTIESNSSASSAKDEVISNNTNVETRSNASSEAIQSNKSIDNTLEATVTSLDKETEEKIELNNDNVLEDYGTRRRSCYDGSMITQNHETLVYAKSLAFEPPEESVVELERTEVIIIFSVETKNAGLDFLPLIETSILDYVAEKILMCSEGIYDKIHFAGEEMKYVAIAVSLPFVDGNLSEFNNWNKLCAIKLFLLCNASNLFIFAYDSCDVNVSLNLGPCNPIHQQSKFCHIISRKIIVETQQKNTIPIENDVLQNVMEYMENKHFFQEKNQTNIVTATFLGPDPDRDWFTDYYESGNKVDLISPQLPDKSKKGIGNSIWIVVAAAILMILVGTVFIRKVVMKDDWKYDAAAAEEDDDDSQCMKGKEEEERLTGSNLAFDHRMDDDTTSEISFSYKD